jgi:dolichol-phosphate mannosyltransferase
MNNIPSISVIMPALNEEENIQRAANDVLGSFESSGIDGELVLVNDGSSDNTGTIIAELVSKHERLIKVVTHETPEGIGASFWDGVRHASKEAVVMLPGDGENIASEILKYLPLMEYVDIIVPYVANKNIRGQSRNFISKVFLFAINFSFGLSLNYTNGTVVYRRSVFSEINCVEKGFFYQVEALVKAIRKGYLFAEVPYFLSTRSSGKSNALSTRSLIRVITAYFRLLREVYVSGLPRSKKSCLKGPELLKKEEVRNDGR